jgi:hypothetical protein
MESGDGSKHGDYEKRSQHWGDLMEFNGGGDLVPFFSTNLGASRVPIDPGIPPPASFWINIQNSLLKI